VHEAGRHLGRAAALFVFVDLESATFELADGRRTLR